MKKGIIFLFLIWVAIGISKTASAEIYYYSGTMDAAFTVEENVEISIPAGITKFIYNHQLAQTYDYSVNSQSVDLPQISFSPQPDTSETKTDEFENQYAELVWNDPPPGTITGMVTYSVNTTANWDKFVTSDPFPINCDFIPEGVSPFLQATEHIQSDNPMITSLASSLTDGLDQEWKAVLAIIGWVMDNITYGQNQNIDAVSTYIDKVGACSNFSYLTCAILRAAGIPARKVSGLSLSKPYSLPYEGGSFNSIDSGQGFHAWIEAYYPSLGWVPYDPQRDLHHIDTHQIFCGTGKDTSPMHASWQWFYPSGLPPDTFPSVSLDLAINWTSDNIDLAYVKESEEINDTAFSTPVNFVPNPDINIISGSPSIMSNFTEHTIVLDGDEVVAYKYKLDGGSWSDEIAIGTPTQLSDLSEGTHTLYVIGKDSNGYWQAVVYATITTWTTDITPPTAIISGSPAIPTNSTSADLTVGGADVVAYKYKLNSGSYSSKITVGTQISLSPLAEDTHTLFVIGKDTAGNWQSTDSATTTTWTVDTTAPVITELTDDLTPTQIKTWTWDDTDASSTTFRYLIDQNETCTPTGDFTDTKTATKNGVDGTWYIHVQAKDAAENESDVVTVLGVLDNTAPPASASPAGGLFNANQSITLSANETADIYYTIDGSNPSTSSTKYASPINITKTTTIKFIAIDTAGNQSSVHTETYTIDTEPPATGTITISDTQGYTNQAKPTLKLASTGAAYMRFALSEEALSATSWLVFAETYNDFDISAGGEGAKTVWVEFKDMAGNIQTTHSSDSTMYDTTPPTVSSTSPTNGATDVAVDITITATFSEEMDGSTITTITFLANDDSSNIAGTVSTLTQGDTTATFTPTTTLEYNTTYTAAITTGVKDLAGNVLEAGYTWSFTTKEILAGDINDDGDVNLTDAILALQILSGAEPASSVYAEADVDRDDKIGMAEVIYILQKVSGMRD